MLKRLLSGITHTSLLTIVAMAFAFITLMAMGIVVLVNLSRLGN